MFVDTFLIKFYDLMDKKFISLTEKKISYSIITGVCLILELIIFSYVKKLIKKTKINTKINLRLTNKIVYISQFVLIIIISILIIQIFSYNYYNSYLLRVLITIVFCTASLLIGKILILFISWYRTNRNRVFFIYSLSLSMIIFNLIMTTVVLNLIIFEKPEQIRQFVGGSVDLTAGKYSFLLFIFKISSVLSFGSIWLTTALLLQTSKDQLFKKLRNWSILCLPIAYFLISYFAQNIFSTIFFHILQTDPVNFSLILTTFIILSKPIGGLIFGLLFWRISKLISFEKTLRDYMVIAGYGFLLLFSSNQPTSLALGPYPPFGIASITILVVSSYLIMIGIYVSATFLTANADLRKAIYKKANELKLLDLIGKVEFEKEIEKTIDKFIKQKTVFTESKDDNFKLDSVELKIFMGKVMDELKKDEKDQ